MLLWTGLSDRRLHCNQVNLSLTNCVGYEKLLFHERYAVSSGVVAFFDARV